MTRRKTDFLTTPDDSDKAACYADTARELTTAISHLSRAGDELGPMQAHGENARVGRFDDIVALLTEHRDEVREHAAELDPTQRSTDRHGSADGYERPDDFDDAPLPEIVFDSDSMTVTVTRTDARHVPDRYGNKAVQWAAGVTCPNGQLIYGFADFDDDEARIDVEAGDIVAIGYKRHDRDKQMDFYHVRDDRIDYHSKQTARSYLRDREAVIA